MSRANADDSIATSRETYTGSGVDHSVVNQLLTEMDGVSDRGDVVVIGATNRRDLVDPALLRSGRLETHLELGLPEVSARRAMLGISDVPFAADVDLDHWAERCEGLSFADISGLLREAALTALRTDSSAPNVNAAHLEQALAARTAR